MNIRLFWFFWIPAVFIFAFFIPPFQKPDEPAHFLRAMALSRGEVHCSITAKGIRYFPLPKSVMEFPNLMQTDSIVMHSDNKFPIGLLKSRFSYKNDKTITDTFPYCSLPIVSYIPLAAAAIAVSPFDNLLLSFYAMRLTEVILLLVIAYIGFIVLPKRYRVLYLFLMANPMFIHQATSVSYDASINIFILLSASAWLRCMDEKRINWKMTVLLLASVLITIAVKPGYYLLAGILLPVIGKIPIKKNQTALIIAAFCVSGIILFPSLQKVIINTFLTKNSPQIYIIFHDPLYFLSVILRTITESRGQLTLGLFGLFGWLDYQLPISIMLLYAFFGGVVSYEYFQRQLRPMRIWVLALLGFILTSTVILVFYLFYRNATPSAYYQVEGIQGRYFLPLLPFAIIFFLESIIWLKIKGLLPWLLAGIGVISIYVFSVIIYGRYYDYSKNFNNPDALVNEIKKGVIIPDLLSPITVSERRSFTYDVSEGYKIGGVQIIVANELDIDVPYKISLKDSTCTTIFYQGYLNELRNQRLAHLKGANDIVTTHYFPITRVPGNKVCLTLEPFAAAPNPVYMRLLGDQGQPVIRFLYIAK